MTRMSTTTRAPERQRRVHTGSGAGLAGLFLALSAVLGLHGCGGGSTDVADPVRDDSARGVKIGLLITQTGNTASYGSQIDDAIRLAAAEINAAGGVNGEPIELLLRDDKSSAETGVQEAQRLLDAGAVAVIGAITSRVTLPVAQQVTIPAGVALISPSSTAIPISTLDDNDSVWRTTPSDAFQSAVLARYLLEHRGTRRIAVVFVDDAYGRGLSEQFAVHFQAGGGEIIRQLPLDAEQVLGFGAAIDTLYQDGEPPALLTISFAQQTANFLRELNSAKSRLPTLFAADSAFDNAMLSSAPLAIAGMQGTSPGAPVLDSNYQNFVSNYRQRVGHDPVAFGDAAYDALYLIALALQQGGSNTRAAVRNNLRRVSRADGDNAVRINVNEFARARALIASGVDIDYQGASGRIDLDSNGDPSSGTYLIWEVVQTPDSRLQFVQREVISFP